MAGREGPLQALADLLKHPKRLEYICSSGEYTQEQTFEWVTKFKAQIVTSLAANVSADRILELIDLDAVHQCERGTEADRTLSIVLPLLLDALTPAALGQALRLFLRHKPPHLSDVQALLATGSLSPADLSGAASVVAHQLCAIPEDERRDGPGWMPTYDPHPIHEDPDDNDGTRNADRAHLCVALFRLLVDAGGTLDDATLQRLDSGVVTWQRLLRSPPRNCYMQWFRGGMEAVRDSLWLMRHYPALPPPLPPAA